jgi:hypothetical protein
MTDGYIDLSYVLSLGVVACNHSFHSPRRFGSNLVEFRTFVFRNLVKRTQNVGEEYPRVFIRVLCIPYPNK